MMSYQLSEGGRWDRREHDAGRMQPVVEHALPGATLVAGPVRVEGLPGVRVRVEAGEVARRDLDPEAVAGAEHVAGRSELDAIGRTGRGPKPAPRDPVAHADGASVRPDVDELRGEIRVRGVG